VLGKIAGKRAPRCVERVEEPARFQASSGVATRISLRRANDACGLSALQAREDIRGPLRADHQISKLRKGRYWLGTAQARSRHRNDAELVTAL